MKKRKAAHITDADRAKLKEMKADGERMMELMSSPRTQENATDMRRLLAKAKADARAMRHLETLSLGGSPSTRKA